jgi:O-antigen/teichoic acid export membrane protein
MNMKNNDSTKLNFRLQTVSLLVTMVLGYAFSYFYLLAMGRALGPITFGVLGALFSIFYITSLFGQTLMETVATNIAEIKARDGETAAIDGYKMLVARLSLLCLLPTVVFLAACQPIASFFHLSSVLPIIILAIALYATLAVSIIMGFLQGFQEFIKLGIMGYLIAQGSKLILGVIFVLVGWGLGGALGTLLASSAIAAFIGLAFLKKYLNVKPHDKGKICPDLGRVLWPALVLAVFSAVPASVDVILVSHYFGGQDAGLYNAIATIGKVVFFLPLAVSFVLLPRATENHAAGRDSRHLLIQGLLATLVLSGLITLVCWVFPNIMVIFFGNAYNEAGHLLGFYTTVMLVFSLNIVLVRYSFAIRKLWVMYQASMVTIVEVIAIIFTHRSLSEIIWILLLGNLIIFVPTFLYLIFRKGTVKRPDQWSFAKPE